MGRRRFALGVLGGARLTEALAGTPYRLSKRVFAGVSLDVNVAHAFSIETDGEGYDGSSGTTIYNPNQRNS